MLDDMSDHTASDWLFRIACLGFAFDHWFGPLVVVALSIVTYAGEARK